MSSRKLLLKLSKPKLIKKCKQNNVDYNDYNGTKKDMIDKILNRERCIHELCSMGDQYYMNDIAEFMEDNDDFNCNKIAQHILGKYYYDNNTVILKFKEYIHSLFHDEMKKIYPNHSHKFSRSNKCFQSEQFKNKKAKKKQPRTHKVASTTNVSTKYRKQKESNKKKKSKTHTKRSMPQYKSASKLNRKRKMNKFSIASQSQKIHTKRNVSRNNKIIRSKTPKKQKRKEPMKPKEEKEEKEIKNEKDEKEEEEEEEAKYEIIKKNDELVRKFNINFPVTYDRGKHSKKREARLSDPNVHLNVNFRILMPTLIAQRASSHDKIETQSSPSDEMVNIKNEIQTKMKCILGDKTTYEITKESEDSHCCASSIDYINKIELIDQLKAKCEPLKRIEIVLYAYHRLIDRIDKAFWNKIEIGDIIQVNDKYGHQQLFNDFCHIRYIHIIPDNDANRSHDHNEYDKRKYNNLATKLCQYFEEKCPCKYSKDIQQCFAFTRHYRERTNDEREQFLYFQKSKLQPFLQDDEANDNEITLQQECDKIHSYFAHSTIKFGTESTQTNAEQEAEIHGINRFANSPYFVNNNMPLQLKQSISTSAYGNEIFEQDPSEQKTGGNSNTKNKKYAYSGKKDDDLWWKAVSPNKDEKQSDDEIYGILVENMGVFRWQNPHGFAAGKNQETAHYKPKWSNIKEEALQNEYEALSKDNWNQTLRKSNVFFQSWARQRIRTKYKGYFDDQITGQKQKWSIRIEITMQEVVILKLYTDFDKLQSALKKCFRFETVEDILDGNDDEKEVASQKETKQDLKNRLENFYHWRGGLLIVLNKFGTKINHQNNMVLYHGVNAKMLIRTSQTLAFNGPLSTSSSYHVARTFATAKGTVLKITSHFPRLNYCNAFDASLISDYPEEQEWLIGFMYVRILEVRTRKLFDKVESFWELIDKVPLSSWIREQFFAIHLFNEQIFSMSEHLERILAQFLKVNRRECCDEKAQKKYQYQYDHFKDWGMDCMCDYICKRYHKGMIVDCSKSVIEEKHIQTKNDNIKDINRKMKVFPIIWKKFNEFRENPNLKQRIKFDTISDHLQRFFMEETEEKEINTGKKQWIVSFDEISTVYPNVKEIHFVNQYKFDDKVLENLIKQIKKGKHNTINKIVFLYYNYKRTNINDGKNMPLNHRIFKDPDTLNEGLKDKLEKDLGWKIKHNKNGNAGYKIRIYLE